MAKPVRWKRGCPRPSPRPWLRSSRAGSSKIPPCCGFPRSGNKVIQRDDELARALGFDIETDKLLPDTILVDLAPADPLIIFVEAVATAGEITEARRGALLDLATVAGFEAAQIAFVTAFEERNAAAFKRAVSNLAWGSFAWCLSEPEHLIVLDGTAPGGIRLLSNFIEEGSTGGRAFRRRENADLAPIRQSTLAVVLLTPDEAGA